MGQILVVNIVSNDEILASGYYHWSGYTQEAANVIRHIITDMIPCQNVANDFLLNTNSSTETINKFEAYLMLDNTGAGLYIADSHDKEIKEFEKLGVAYNYRLGQNRNLGLIALTPEKIKKFNIHADKTVNIDISTDTVEFDVFDKSSEEDVNYEMKRGFVDEEDIKELDFDFIDRFTFDQCDAWYDKIVEMCNDKSYPFFRHKTDPFYYRVIA